ncbi:MAG: hypothetical protein ACJ71T_09105 [Actinomycetales bacterium]
MTIAVLLLFVLAGATGFLGTHTRTATASSGGYRMTVTYAWVARPGQDVPWRVHVHCPGGCQDDITLAVSAEYFRIFETQGFSPSPQHSTSDGKFVYLTFSKPPAGHDFGVDYDAYIQPGSHTGAPATVRLIVQSRLITELRIHTWLAP